MSVEQGVASAAEAMPLTTRLADMVISLDQVDSTNAYARRLLAQNGAFSSQARRGAPPDEPALLVISADDQTAGHGRLGRSWVGASGQSLMVSFATALPRRLATDPALNGWLQMTAGVAMVDALKEALRTARPRGADSRLMLKWPNDVFCAGRKLGGILCELVPLDERRSGVIIGVGINLRIPSDRMPTSQSTSLQLHWSPLPDTPRLRDQIVAAAVRRLRSLLGAFARDPRAESHRLRERVIEDSVTLGRLVTVTMGDGRTVTGTASAINEDASLTVRGADGTTTVVTTGDVGVLPSPRR